MIPVVSVVGYSNSGKTTLLVQLIKELTARGYKIATIKHHHKEIETDVPGKDTWKHAQAGAAITVLASLGKISITEKTEGELSLDDIVSKISGVDLIITEGFKKEKKPKIEVFRPDLSDRLISPPEHLLAVVSEVNFEEVPTFSPNDVRGLADFLINRLEINKF